MAQLQHTQVAAAGPLIRVGWAALVVLAVEEQVELVAGPPVVLER
jgi:hypothetical protein